MPALQAHSSSSGGTVCPGATQGQPQEHFEKFFLISFQICTRGVWKTQNHLSKLCELPCLILIKYTGMHKTGICQGIKSTRGRFQANIAEKLTKLLIYSLDVRPQGGHGCQKNEKNP